MKRTSLLAIALSLLVMLSAPIAFALECSKHIFAAEEAMHAAELAMRKEPMDRQALFATLRDDASMLLESAKDICRRANTGEFDVARAIAKAGAARAYATAAEIWAKEGK